MILLTKKFKISQIVLGIFFHIMCVIPIKGQTLLHSHNDYQRQFPLHDAIRLDYDIIEVDVFLRNDTLVVCHDKKKVLHAPTLFDVYISKLVDYNLDQLEGKIIMLDIKEYSDGIITAIINLQKRNITNFKHVTILLSGNFDRMETLNKIQNTNILLDGRFNDIKSLFTISTIPIISLNIKDFVNWNGRYRIKRKEALRLKSIIDEVHASGKKIRFWNTYDHPQTWNILRVLGVDIIGVDNLELMANYYNLSTD